MVIEDEIAADTSRDVRMSRLGDEVVEDNTRTVNMSRMSLMSAIQGPSIDPGESDIELAIGDPKVASDKLLYILSNDNVDSRTKGEKTSLQDVYGSNENGSDDSSRTSKLKSKFSSLKIRSPRKINMTQVDSPPLIETEPSIIGDVIRRHKAIATDVAFSDDDVNAGPIRVQHTEYSTRDPFPYEGARFSTIDRGANLGTFHDLAGARLRNLS